MKPKKINPKILAALEETGLPFTFERGSKHIHVRVSGRLACIWPSSGGHERGDGHLKLVAQIKRVAREVRA